MIQSQKEELVSKDKTIEQLKHDSRGTYCREIKAERNAFQDEASRLRQLLEKFIEQIGGVDQILNFRGYFDQQKEHIQQLEEHQNTQQQMYEAKHQECEELAKQLVDTQMERDDANQAVRDKLKEMDKLKEKFKKKEADMNSKVNDLNDEIETHTSKISDLMGTIKRMQKERDDLKQVIQDCKSTIADREYEIEDMKGANEELEAKINKHKLQIKDLEERMTNAQNEHQNAMKKLTKEKLDSEENYKGQIQTKEEEIVGLINERHKLSEEFEEKNKEQEENIEELQNKIKAIQLENQKINEDFHKYKQNVADEKERLERQLDDRDDQIQTKNDQLLEKDEKLHQMETKHESEMNEINKAFSDLKTDYQILIQKTQEREKGLYDDEAEGEGDIFERDDASHNYKTDKTGNIQKGRIDTAPEDDDRHLTAAYPPSKRGRSSSRFTNQGNEISPREETSQEIKEEIKQNPSKNTMSEGSADFERASDEDDILESHITRNDREKIKDLFDKVNNQDNEEAHKPTDGAEEAEGESIHKRHPMFEDGEHDKEQKSKESGVSSEFDRYDDGEYHDEEEQPVLVTSVKREEIKEFAKIVLDYCQERDINIIDIEQHIFDDFSITHKVTVTQLANVFNSKFNIDQEGSVLLARYMIEQPNFSKDERANMNEDEEYEFNPDKALSHAKVLSRLQSLLSNMMING